MTKKKQKVDQKLQPKLSDQEIYELIAKALVENGSYGCRAITAETVARIRTLPQSGPQLPCADEARGLLRSYGLLVPVEPERSAATVLKIVSNSL